MCEEAERLQRADPATLSAFTYERRVDWTEADAIATLSSFLKRKFDPKMFKVRPTSRDYRGEVTQVSLWESGVEIEKKDME